MSRHILVAMAVLWIMPARVRSEGPHLPAIAGERTADVIAKEAEVEIKANRRSRPTEEFQASDRKIEALVGELREKFPRDARLSDLLIERWWAGLRLDHAAEVRKDVRSIIDTTKNAKLKADAFYIDAVMALKESEDVQAIEDIADKFMTQAPGDDRAAVLLMEAFRKLEDPQSKIEENDPERARLAKRILDEFPKSVQALRLIGRERQKDQIGVPFELEFTDAISGKNISMKNMRGKVVVLDFWATWCGPCIAEIPHFKELYDQYKDNNVEFIGVSLDSPEEDGGLERLKDFVRRHEIKWPQYYIGQKFAGDFPTSWGIDAIPVSFIVDAEGNLFSTQARGKLDQMIPLLLERAGQPQP